MFEINFPVVLSTKQSPATHQTPPRITHFAVYAEAFGLSDINDYVMIQTRELRKQSNGTNGQIVYFTTDERRQDFLKWLEDYSSWFVDCNIDNSQMPMLPRSGTHTVSFVRATKPTNEVGEWDIGKEWCWIVKNCKNPVWRTNDLFAFTDDEEAAHFKLTMR
jgi:hypothetical protein